MASAEAFAADTVPEKMDPASALVKTPKTLVNLSKLTKSSLKRYRRHFKLAVKANPSKADLLAAVALHWAEMPDLREDDVLALYSKTLPLSAQPPHAIAEPTTNTAPFS
mmetsp:Transcript_15960/g.34521  ORF Transcript_15960/g.34521 Transcript_15960/m.34521 type:complete len:109 (+) Transcript_15960:240-566(+)